MTARLLDGRAVATLVLADVRTQSLAWQQTGHPAPTLAVVRLGDEPASVRYAGQLQRALANAAMRGRVEVLPEVTVDDALARFLRELSHDPSVNGILLQLPLPSHLDAVRASDAIDPSKDVDGVTSLNAGRLYLGRGQYFVPATAAGGIELLCRSGIDVAGRHAVVVGRSVIVGRPLALELLRRQATVTICHSQTPDLARFTRQADVLAVAVGRPGLIRADMVRPGAVVLDFGVNVVDGSVVGDVDFAGVAAVAGAITPVPGGTGPMTNAMLLANTLAAARWQVASPGAGGATSPVRAGETVSPDPTKTERSLIGPGQEGTE